MIRIFLAAAALFMLSSCASPAIHMSDQEVATLSDDQLCDFNNNYRSESKTKAEIARRGLNCERFHRACLKQGIQENTKAMDYCVSLSRENERLRYDRSRSNFDVFGFGDYDDIRAVRRF